METQEPLSNQPNNSGEMENHDDSGAERVKHFASLLGEVNSLDKDSESDKDNTELSEDKNKEKEVKLESLDDLAKALKTDKAKLYDVKLKLRETGKEITLGELKDHYQEYDDIDVQRLEWHNEKKNQELELANARKEIEVLASLLPKDALNKEKLEAARQIVAAQLERQRKDLLRRVPEWNDSDIRKDEIEKINNHLKEYDLTFKDISDSRIAHYIRNNWLRELAVEKALAKVRLQRKQTSAPSRKGDESRIKSGRKITPRAQHIARHILNEDG